MEQCERIQKELNESFGGAMPREELLPEHLRSHLDGCPDCREYLRGLRETGRRLEEIGQRLNATIQVPERAYFATLIDRVEQRRVPFFELLAFVGAGIAILTGMGIAFRTGYSLVVEAFLGLVAMLLPLLILTDSLREGTEREE